MLKLQILDEQSEDSIPLSKIHTGEITAGRLWFIEQRGDRLGIPSMSKNFETIGYLTGPNETVLRPSSDSDAVLNLRSVHLTATTVCNRQTNPQPLYYLHICQDLPIEQDIGIEVIDAETETRLPNDHWRFDPPTLNSNGRLWLSRNGHFTVSYTSQNFNAVEPVMLQPAIKPWPRGATVHGNPLRLDRWMDTASGKMILRGQVDAGTSSTVLTVTNDRIETSFFEIKIGVEDPDAPPTEATHLHLRENGISVTSLRLDVNSTIDRLRDAINRIPGWKATLAAPRRTRVYESSPYLVPMDWTNLGTGDNFTLPIKARCVFIRSMAPEPFKIMLPDYPRNTSWFPRVSAGSSWTIEPVSEDDQNHLDVGSSCTCFWNVSTRIDGIREAIDQSGLSAGDSAAVMETFNDLFESIGVPSETPRLEQLRQLDRDGYLFQASSRMILEITDLWIGDRKHASVETAIHTIDRLTGQIRLSFPARGEHVQVRYRFLEDSYILDGFLNPIAGEWVSVELNPFLEKEDAFRSRLVVMTPALVNYGEQSIINPSPLRMVITDNPYQMEKQLEGHWSTTISSGTKTIQLPYRVIGVLHFRPMIGPSQVMVEDVRRPGGNLVKNPTAEQLRSLSQYPGLEDQRAHQLNQTLVIHLPRELQRKFGESAVTRSVERLLPASTFFVIQWY